MSAYDGVITLNGDDLTGEVSDDGDDEEIRIFLDNLPSEVQIFTVQLNSYTLNSLKYVKSAYIRLSADSEVIGTYSINKGGNKSNEINKNSNQRDTIKRKEDCSFCKKSIKL